MMPYSHYDKSELECPKCKVPTFVPDKDVERLPKNYGLLELLTSSHSSTPSSAGFHKRSIRGSHHGRPIREEPLYCEGKYAHIHGFRN